ncbi:MAG: hypothetical protein K6F46_02315 [Desulfovibrio sp.]|nr:hypothetical protein [Desulfovibrio sp.]
MKILPTIGRHLLATVTTRRPRIIITRGRLSITRITVPRSITIIRAIMGLPTIAGRVMARLITAARTRIGIMITVRAVLSITAVTLVMTSGVLTDAF